MSMQRFWILAPVCLAFMALISASAGAVPTAVASPAAKASAAAVLVHETWQDGERHVRHSKRHHRHRSHVVDAPFAYVESGRRTYVDAPFAEVYVGRRGRHVRAPFVDLWIPR